MQELLITEAKKAVFFMVSSINLNGISAERVRASIKLETDVPVRFVPESAALQFTFLHHSKYICKGGENTVTRSRV